MLSYLGFVCDSRLVGELDLGRLQYRVLLEDGRLRLVVPERFLPVQTLVENHPHAPHVHLRGYLWRVLSNYKTLGRQVPVNTNLTHKNT